MKTKLDLTLNTPQTDVNVVDTGGEETTARTPQAEYGHLEAEYRQQNENDLDLVTYPYTTETLRKPPAANKATNEDQHIKYKNNILNYYFNDKSLLLDQQQQQQHQKYANTYSQPSQKTYRATHQTQTTNKNNNIPSTTDNNNHNHSNNRRHLMDDYNHTDYDHPNGYYAANKPTSRINFNSSRQDSNKLTNTNNLIGDELGGLLDSDEPEYYRANNGFSSPNVNTTTTRNLTPYNVPGNGSARKPNALPPLSKDASQDILNTDESGYAATTTRSPPLVRRTSFNGGLNGTNSYRSQLIGNVGNSNIDLVYNLAGTILI